EDVGGDLLHRRREAAPDLAGHPDDGGAGPLAPRPVREPGEPDPPPAQPHALAQPRGDDLALGRHRPLAGHRAPRPGQVAAPPCPTLLLRPEVTIVRSGATVAGLVTGRRAQDRSR